MHNGITAHLTHLSDSGSWDTSKAYVRRTLEKSIELGRRYRNADKPKREDKYEAFRLLGAAVSSFSLHVKRPSADLFYVESSTP